MNCCFNPLLCPRQHLCCATPPPPITSNQEYWFNPECNAHILHSLSHPASVIVSLKLSTSSTNSLCLLNFPGFFFTCGFKHILIILFHLQGWPTSPVDLSDIIWRISPLYTSFKEKWPTPALWTWTDTAVWGKPAALPLTAIPGPRPRLGMSCVTSAQREGRRPKCLACSAWPHIARPTFSLTMITLLLWSTSWSKPQARWERRSVPSMTSCWRHSVALIRPLCVFSVWWMNTNTMTLSPLEQRGLRNKWVAVFIQMRNKHVHISCD